MEENKKNIFIAGHNGMVGSALHRLLKNVSNVNLITKNRNELDLCNQNDVKNFFYSNEIDEVYIAAGLVGGINANDNKPANFIYENTMINVNVIHYAYMSGVKKLMALGSSCIYPKYSKQPINEEDLMTGSLERTNEFYGIAKITALKLCESYRRQYKVDFRSAMPTNLYGIGDNYNPSDSHVIPGLIRKFHEAKIKKKESVEIWGTGSPIREFLYVDDLASALIEVMNISYDNYNEITNENNRHINIGSGLTIAIKDLALRIKKIIGFNGHLIFDESKPDGTPIKIINSEKFYNFFKWQPSMSLEDGLKLSYNDFIKRCSKKD